MQDQGYGRLVSVVNPAREKSGGLCKGNGMRASLTAAMKETTRTQYGVWTRGALLGRLHVLVCANSRLLKLA